MAEIRRDPITDRWIIVSVERPMGPADFDERMRFSPTGLVCPFCPGNEKITPHEIARRPRMDAPEAKPWTMRVVPNRFPALRIEGDLNRTGFGVYDFMNGIGAHEVIIETPDHTRHLADLSHQDIMTLFDLFTERVVDLKKDKRFLYILLFKNFGEAAGASLSHSHSQLIALPIIPKRVQEELESAKTYFKRKERCLFCDCIDQEVAEAERIVMETQHVLCFTPFGSRFPFELWILPKKHVADFVGTPPEILEDIGKVLLSVLGAMRTTLNNPAYNFLIHTSPLEAVSPEEYHWHIEVMPRLTRVAGFEWGSGFYVNPTPPELAARFLRGEKVLF